MKTVMPHIKVVVEYGGDKAEHIGTHFIDAIKFLVDCETIIRRNSNLNTQVDVETTKIGKCNLEMLMSGDSNAN